MELAKKKIRRSYRLLLPVRFQLGCSPRDATDSTEKLLLAELEIWPNLISATKASGAQVAVFNGRLSENSFRGYRRIRPLVSAVLRKIDLIAAQNETYAERFRLLGARESSVCVTGSMKYDGAQTDRNHPKAVEVAPVGRADRPGNRLSGEAPKDPRGGGRSGRVSSSGRPVERVAIDSRAATPGTVRRGGAVVGRIGSKLATSKSIGSGRPADLRNPDSLGRHDRASWGAWWASAEIAFVGGSFGSRGGQNMIEPAAYGAAVSFGPNTWNFRDIVTGMLADDAAVVVDDAAAMERVCSAGVWKSPGMPNGWASGPDGWSKGSWGATARTVDLLAE